MATIPVDDDGTGTTGIVVGKPVPQAPIPVYFETLYAGVESWYNRLALEALRHRKGTPEQTLQEVAESLQPMRYETSQEKKVAIIRDGKCVSWMVLSLYRMQSGRYEVTAYLS